MIHHPQTQSIANKLLLRVLIPLFLLLTLSHAHPSPSLQARGGGESSISRRAGGGGGGGSAGALGAAASIGGGGSSTGGSNQNPDNTLISPGAAPAVNGRPQNIVNPFDPSKNSAGDGFDQLDASKAVCFNTAGAWKFCVPAGTYNLTANWWGFDFTLVTDVSIPSGANVTFPLVDGDGNTNNKTFTSNTTAAADSDFKKVVNKDTVPKFMTVNLAPRADPPAVCLYDDKDYTGKFACFGTGRGKLPDNMQNSVTSVRFLGRAYMIGYFSNMGENDPNQYSNNQTNLDGYNDKLVAFRAESSRST
ncbi:MAG: hypothetical protein M1825_001086 [Sarcosagium campestre]|nr:MAG: hypothetical protein M1825_001086 [Sarcosagium campestre]